MQINTKANIAYRTEYIMTAHEPVHNPNYISYVCLLESSLDLVDSRIKHQTVKKWSVAWPPSLSVSYSWSVQFQKEHTH